MFLITRARVAGALAAGAFAAGLGLTAAPAASADVCAHVAVPTVDGSAPQPVGTCQPFPGPTRCVTHTGREGPIRFYEQVCWSGV